MKKKKASKKRIPSADIILSLLNDESDSPDKILKHYDQYIKTASKEFAYGEGDQIVSFFINEDLAQEIRLAVLHCLPTLRRAVYKKFFEKNL